MSQINNITSLQKSRPRKWFEPEFNSYLTDLETFVRQVYDNLTGLNDTKVFLVAELPSAVDFDPDKTGRATFIYVSDESGGAQMAFSDGTNWRRFSDRAIVS